MSVRYPTAVVAEDEPLSRAQLKELLHKTWPELAIVAEAEDGVEAIHALEQFSPDALFLDIQMPGPTGLEIARHASGNQHVVFVTAYERYAIAAFEQGAVDYLMKPLDITRVRIACDRVRKRMSAAPANLEPLLELLSKRAAQGSG